MTTPHQVSELYGRHDGDDIYVIGTGPSLRVFPLEFLADKITIGLNMAWRALDPTYGITIHPELNIPEFLPGEQARPGITWVTKSGKLAPLDERQVEYAMDHFYFFEAKGKPNSQPPNEPSDAGRVVEWLARPTGDALYQWSSISQTAASLAANLGARNVILVGCDNGSLRGNHHQHAQHTRWKGVDPDHRYEQYYEGLVEVRTHLRARNVNLVAATPFLSLAEPDLDFDLLCSDLGVPALVDSVDISPPLHEIAAVSARRIAVPMTGSSILEAPRKLVRNLRAVLSGQDLLTRERQAQSQVEKVTRQAEDVIRGVIDRHYLGAEPPPPELQEHVGPKAGTLAFWTKGMASSKRVLATFGEEPTSPVLDWGCGSGRTLLWLRAYPAWRQNYHGCDVDQAAIAWLKEQGETNVAVCGDLPPLPYPDDLFAGLFSFSVLTHISANDHRRWYEELHRVVIPGGRVYVTTHGRKIAQRSGAATEAELRAKDRVWIPLSGHYKDSCIVSERFIREAVAGLFDVVSFEESAYGPQDVTILRNL